MTEGDDVRGLVVDAIAYSAIVDHSAARQRLQQSHFPYEQYGGHPHYGYYPYPEEQKFIGIIPWILRILKLCAVGLMLFSSSLTMYGACYWAVMPGSYVSRPLFFDYTGTVVYPHQNGTPTTTSIATASTTESQDETHIAATHTPQNLAYTPCAFVDLFAMEQAVSWGETIHADLIPPPTIKDRILQPGKEYNVAVHLTLPESQWNRQIGMFGVAVDLVSHPDQNGTTIKLASSVRPARLPYESGWLAVVRKLVWIVPLVFGGMEENRVVIIPSFRHVVESQDYPLRHVAIRLVSQRFLHQQRSQKSAEQSNISPVEVVGGEVRIGKELNHWQQVLKDWFYTCYMIGTLLLFGAHVGVLILLQYYRGEKEGFDEPYFDPSCDFSGRHNDDFESIHSNESRAASNWDSMGYSENEGGYSEDCSSDGNFNESSEHWEECPPTEDEQQDEDEVDPQAQNQSVNGWAPTCTETQQTISQHRESPFGIHDGSYLNQQEDLKARLVPQAQQSEGTSAVEKRQDSRIRRYAALVNANAKNKATPSPLQPAGCMPGPSQSLHDDESMQCREDFEGLNVDDNGTIEQLDVDKAREDYDATISSNDRNDKICFYDCAEAEGPGAYDGSMEFGCACSGQSAEKSPPSDDSCSDREGAIHSSSRLWSSCETTDNKASNKPHEDVEESTHCKATIKIKEAGSPAFGGKTTAPRRDSDDKESSSNVAQSVVEKQRDCIIYVRNDDLGHAPQNTLFQVPEAQVLDSFLHDLINPFVR